MNQMRNHGVATTLHALIDWTQARLSERESWDGVTLIILSLLLMMVSSLVVYLAWAGVAYGGWLVWRKGSWKRLTGQNSGSGIVR
jgi:hypothetical protein